jgi:hypothetical protein
MTEVLCDADLPVTVFAQLPMRIPRVESVRAPSSVPAIERNDAEREDHMAVTDSLTLERLRREESVAEREGRQALNIAAILKNHPQHDAARQKADALLAKASALREQIVKIETA